MTGYFFKAVAAALLAVILSGLFQRDNASMAMVLRIATGVLLLLFGAMLLQPVREYLEQLAEAGDFQQAYLLPILKCTGIGIITQVASSVCKDAGEGSVASMIELGGCIAALFLSLPLFTAVLELINGLLGA